MYGPVRTVVWQGSAGDRRPYADLVGKPSIGAEKLARAVIDSQLTVSASSVTSSKRGSRVLTVD